MKMNEIPLTQRPRERAMQYGTEVLSEAELLSILLRCGTKGKNSLELANEILAIDKGREGLSNLMCCDLSDFKRIKGLGKVKAIQLECICELARRFSRSHTERNRNLDGPSEAAAFFMESMRHLDHEIACIYLTDSRNRFIRSVEIAKGSIDAAALSTREIIKSALRYGAAGFILVHNHPSGVYEPSSEDISFSRTLRDAGKLMNIRMNDSIIIGEGAYLSLRERGLI